MKAKKHILIVDDVTTNLKCLGEILRNNYALSMAKSGEQAIQMMGKVSPDLVLMDVKMPGMDGYETFKIMKEDEHLKDIPVVFLTADTENDSELKGLKLGASDFIKKPYEPEIMIQRIERVLSSEEKNRIIREDAKRDPLTGLWNRSYIKEKINLLDPETDTGTFFILDLDNFKGINDNYGHVAGDSALIAFAKTLVGFIHKDDIVARIGGDEFAVFLKGSYGKELLGKRIENLIKQVEEELKIIRKDNSISSVSIGISAFPFDGKNFIELYNNSDKALYYVKRNGKSGFHFYDPSESLSFSDADESEAIDLSHLKSFIDENDDREGPFYVEYNNFKSIYKFLKRYSLRTGTKIQVLMFTLKDLSLAGPGNQDDINKAMELLDECIKDTLRKNDVSTKFTPHQQIVILMDVDEENRAVVTKRIMNLWNSKNTNQNVLLKYDIEQIICDGMEIN